MAHSHDFFGNTTTDADFTYESLLAGGTTRTRFEEDKAAYWIPTVSWNGKVLNSNRAVFYYRAGGKNHKGIQPYPAGLKIIAGGERRVWWTCGRDEAGKGSRTPPDRRGSEELGVRVIFPDCIDVARDGKPLLDSPDHRAHTAYSKRIDGKVRCPRSHLRSVPVLTMNATFPRSSCRGGGDARLQRGACLRRVQHARRFLQHLGADGARTPREGLHKRRSTLAAAPRNVPVPKPVSGPRHARPGGPGASRALRDASPPKP
jgi:hypothetical protein